MNYLTIEEILFMHHRILVELQPDNNDFTVLNPGNLESAISRPQQSAFGKDAYPDIYSKAAALAESLIGNHCFQDGNKRIGITAGIVFMMNNGYKITVNENDVYQAAMKISKGEWKFDNIRDWFKKNYN